MKARRPARSGPLLIISNFGQSTVRRSSRILLQSAHSACATDCMTGLVRTASAIWSSLSQTPAVASHHQQLLSIADNRYVCTSMIMKAIAQQETHVYIMPSSLSELTCASENCEARAPSSTR